MPFAKKAASRLRLYIAVLAGWGGLFLSPALGAAAGPGASGPAPEAVGLSPAQEAVKQLKASLSREAGERPPNAPARGGGYYVPAPEPRPGPEVAQPPLPVSFTPLSDLGRPARPGLKAACEAPAEAENKGQTGPGASAGRKPKLETSPAKSWPGLMEARAGREVGPAVNPNQGFTVSAPLIEKPEDGETIYLYRHRPAQDAGGRGQVGVMWSRGF